MKYLFPAKFSEPGICSRGGFRKSFSQAANNSKAAGEGVCRMRKTGLTQPQSHSHKLGSGQLAKMKYAVILS